MSNYLCLKTNPTCLLIAHCSTKCNEVEYLIDQYRQDSQRDFPKTFNKIKEMRVCPICKGEDFYFDYKKMRHYHYISTECLYCNTHFGIERELYHKEHKLTGIGGTQGGLINKCRIINLHELAIIMRDREKQGN